MTGVNTDELMRRETNLLATIGKSLPDYSAACQAQDIPVVLFHQDAFAADFQEDEYRLIGMAIKFAGAFGKEVRIHGRNRETLDGVKAVN